MRGNAWRCGAGTGLGEKLKRKRTAESTRSRLLRKTGLFKYNQMWVSVVFESSAVHVTPSLPEESQEDAAFFVSERASERLRHTVSFPVSAVWNVLKLLADS